MVKKIVALIMGMAWLCIAIAQPQLTAENAPWQKGTSVLGRSYIELDSLGRHKVKRFDDLKGKLVILDFWSTSCGACIDHFPALDKLRKNFGDSIAILPVAGDRDTFVLAFQKRRRELNKPGVKMPLISKVTRLDTLVYYHFIPHYAWIDKNGTLTDFTGPHEVTEENIRKKLQGMPTNMPQKVDKLLDWVERKLIFRDGNFGNGESLKTSSVLSGFIEGTPSGSFVSHTGDSISVALVMNMGLKYLYSLAYQNEPEEELCSQELHTSQVRVHSKDSTKYVTKVDGLVQYQNIYNYQLLIKNGTYEELQTAFKKDLDKLFGCKVTHSKQMLPCYVLSGKDTNLLATKGGKTIGTIYPDGTRQFQNETFAWFKRFIKDTFYQLPFVDEVGMKGRIDAVLHCDEENLDSLNKALAAYQLSLTKQERLLDVYDIETPN